LKSEIINLNVDKKDIGLLKFIFEASDGVGLTSTVDVKEGHVILYVPEGQKEDALKVLSSIDYMINSKIF